MREFGIIGKTLVHSFSKKYFEEKFNNEGISNCVFNQYTLESIDEIKSLISSNTNLKGFSGNYPLSR